MEPYTWRAAGLSSAQISLRCLWSLLLRFTWKNHCWSLSSSQTFIGHLKIIANILERLFYVFIFPWSPNHSGYTVEAQSLPQASLPKAWKQHQFIKSQAERLSRLKVLTSVRSSKHRPSSDGALAWLSMHISLWATPFLSPTGFSLSVLMASFHLGSFWWPLFSPTRGESSSNIADWLKSTHCLCCRQRRSVQSGNCVTFNEWGLSRFRSYFALWIKGEWRRQTTNMQKEQPVHQAWIWMYHIYLPWDTNQAHLQHAAVAFLLFLLLLLLQASVKALGSPDLLRQPPPPIHTFLRSSLTWITHDQTVCVELISQLLRGPHRHWWLHKATSPHWCLASPPDVHGGEWWIIGHHSLPSSAVAWRRSRVVYSSTADLQTHAMQRTTALVGRGPHQSL